MLDPQSRFWLQKITAEVYKKYRSRLLRKVKMTTDEEVEYVRLLVKKSFGYGSSEEQKWAAKLQQVVEGVPAKEYEELDENVVVELNNELSHKIQEAVDRGLIKLPPRETMAAYVRNRKN